MGLFKKIKDILYDEEEYTEQIKITPEMRNEQIPNKEEETVKPTAEKKEIIKEEKPKTVESESDLFRNNNSFPFDFDEEEFKQVNNRIQKPVEEPKPVERHSNVLEYERKKKVERRIDYGRYEKTEITETTERKRFKPSPIISPVYGILNQNYEKGDIMQREDAQKMDIQSVRNKAFGDKKVQPKEIVKEEKPKTTFYEESETVTIGGPSEKEKKVKTIDELLENTTDMMINLDNDLTEELESIEKELDMPTKIDKVETSNNEEIDEPTAEMETPKFEDTLENDLFNLIDSMYDNKEEADE